MLISIILNIMLNIKIKSQLLLVRLTRIITMLMAIIYGQDGKEAARIIHRPDKPLSCGATVWIETNNKVEKL
jgi:hypothetical protein